MTRLGINCPELALITTNPDHARRLNALEERISDLEVMVLSLVNTFKTHTHAHITHTGAPNP